MLNRSCFHFPRLDGTAGSHTFYYPRSYQSRSTGRLEKFLEVSPELFLFLGKNISDASSFTSCPTSKDIKDGWDYLQTMDRFSSSR